MKYSTILVYNFFRLVFIYEYLVCTYQTFFKPRSKCFENKFIYFRSVLSLQAKFIAAEK